MAKKQSADTETKPVDGTPAPDASAEGKEPKAEKKPRAPRGEKADKGSPDKGAPDKAAPGKEPAAVAPGAAAPGSPAPAGAPPRAALVSSAQGDKQKKKKPGVPPARGKKLRNQIKN